MFKRLLIVGIGAFALGQVLLVSVQIAQGRGLFSGGEAGRSANEFEQVLRIINEHYVSETDAEIGALKSTALESVLHSLDPHSEFLSEGEFHSFREDTAQEFGGIGVQIEVRDDRLTVVAPIAGTPGERAGLLRGDQIITVDGEDITDMALEACLQLLRGKPGSTVSIEVFRPHSEETFERTITREVIQVESVRDVQMLEDSIGYIRLIQFGERTVDEFLKSLNGLEAQGMKALVLDLRDNPGGLLDVAADVLEPFFERGELILYTQGRDPRTREDIRARRRGDTRDYPIAVLINSGSASASEIVAGALRDTKRAVLVGEKSFGKGSVQTVFPIKGDQAIRLTTALYYLPSGDVINGKGIEPHIPVTLTVDEDRKLAIQRNRLPLMTEQEFAAQFEFDPIEDRQLSAAVDAIRGVNALALVSQKSGDN